MSKPFPYPCLGLRGGGMLILSPSASDRPSTTALISLQEDAYGAGGASAVCVISLYDLERIMTLLLAVKADILARPSGEQERDQ